MDWSGMVYLPTGSSDLILILGCRTSNSLYLSLTTLYSSCFWRTDTIVVSKLNTPPPPLPPSPARGLNRGFTVYKELINWIKLFIVFYKYLLFLRVLLFSTFLVFFGSMCARSKKCIFIWLSIYLPHVLIVVCTSTLVKIMLWSKIAAHECRQRFHPTTFRNF